MASPITSAAFGDGGRAETPRRSGDLAQHAAALRVGAGDAPGAQGGVRHGRDAMLFIPRPYGVLDRPLLHVVEDLVARDTTRAGDPGGGVQVGNVEVSHAPGENLAVALQRLERLDGVLQRVLAGPVQQVAVEVVGAEAGERALAGLDRPLARGVLREYLRHQEHVIASS